MTDDLTKRVTRAIRQWWCGLDDHAGMSATSNPNIWRCKRCGKYVELIREWPLPEPPK